MFERNVSLYVRARVRIMRKGADMAATIRDIKEQTGLSLATISKYLNGGNVLPENRVKIEAAIRDLHYEVNEMARGLVTNRTRTVGVLAYSVESIFNGTLLRHIGNSLRRAGYGLMICDSCDDVKIEAENVNFLLSKKVDGIIALPVSTKTDSLRAAKKAGVPVVLIDRPSEDGAFDCVRIDNRRAAYRAVRFLLENGHREIGIVCSHTEYTGEERYRGYEDAMREANCELRQEYCAAGTHSIEFGFEGMSRLLSLKERPTAVFMTNYELALGAVMALNKTKLHCPGDISLMGFDDLIMSHVIHPRLHMVVQPMKEMGERAAELLLERIGSKEREMAMEIVLGTRISAGDSVAVMMN
jgi:LacI family transcriptional regulator